MSQTLFRRIGMAVAASSILVAGLAVPGVAAEQATLLSPAHGDVVTGRVNLKVRVDTNPVEEVTLRLSRDRASQASSTASIPLPCVEDCEGNSSTIWGNRTFDPTSGAPFSAVGVCNGTWTIQGRLDKGQWLNLGDVVFSAPPLPATSVAATQGNGFGEVTWKRSKTPDVRGYRVERMASGTGWNTIAEVGASEDGIRDTAVSDGTYRYRVVALRPDGIVNGNPVAPCTDTGLDYEATSSEATMKYQAAPTPSPTPTTAPSPGSSPSDGPSSNPSSNPSSSPSGGGQGGTTGQPTGSPSEPSDNGSDPATTDDTANGPNGTATSRPSRSRTVGAPPAAHRQTDTRVTLPGLVPGAEPPPETYYGEDGGVGELDYAGADAIPGQEIIGYDADGQPIYRLVPGAMQNSSLTSLDGGKMRAIAMGLLLVVLALHSRRWIQAS